MIEEIIKKRKSIRLFNVNEIDNNTIYEIIDVARYAPSGKNRQPWKIKIIDAKNKLYLMNILTKKYRSIEHSGSLNISLQAIEQCSKVILVFNPYSYNEQSYSKKTMLMDTQSIGAFIQNILLLSTEKGISTLWINDIYYAKEEIEHFYSNSIYEIIAAIALGYTNKEKKFNTRNDLKDIIF